MKEKLYGSAFSKPQAKEVEKFVSSIDVDKHLIVYDILGSLAHAKMLGEQAIIPGKDTKLLEKGLNSILKKIEQGRLDISALNCEDAEDVHTYVTMLLKKEKVPKQVVDKLHTARSRNDQVVLDARMYVVDALDEIIDLTVDLQKNILKLADKEQHTIMPAYTHLQPAQVIIASHLLLAYINMLEKNKSRLINAQESADIMSLGSGAARGTSFKLDRELVAKELGFSKVSENSIESVSSRDFILETLSAISIFAADLSRISEDLIIYATYEFNFIKIDDSYLTGSSMMPNKKNADTLELIRGFSARALAAFIEVAALMKGLPHAYNRDMQLDKEPLVRSTEGIIDCLMILSGVFKTLKFNHKRLKSYVEENDYLYATDIAEYLVKSGNTYREAHDITGGIIKEAIEKEKKLKDFSDAQLKKHSKKLNKKKIKELTDPLKSVKSLQSAGSSSPAAVAKQIKKWKKVL